MINVSKIKNYASNNIFEIIIFFIFCVLTIACSFFHECSFDELQAWGIAKDNLYNILFYAPHFEGHPPLWHLILKFSQIFTTNPELAVKIPNFLIMYGAVYLLIFKSPFPKILRYSLPFTYFIFYQYSIISRPYCLLVLGLFWAATLHDKRNEHPYQYATSLAVLALSSLYGMILATFISILWAFEVLIKQKVSFKSFITKDKRFFSLLGLFFLCLVISVLIIPAEGVAAYSRFTSLPHWQIIYYFIAGLPADATAFNVFNYHTQFATNIFHIYSLTGWIFGFCFMVSLFKIFIKNHTFSLFLFTYFPILFFMAEVYVHPHHIGIITVIFIYLFWCLLLEHKGENVLRFTPNFKYIILFIMLIQIYWSGMAFYNEYKADYAPSRTFSNYIKENNLTKYKIFGTYHPKSPHLQWLATMVNPYFGRNIFMNYNLEYPGKLYIIHQQKLHQYQVDDLYAKWDELESPDIFLSEQPIPLCWRKNFGHMAVTMSFFAGEVYKDKVITFPAYCYVNKEKLFLKLKNKEYSEHHDSRK